MSSSPPHDERSTPPRLDTNLPHRLTNDSRGYSEKQLPSSAATTATNHRSLRDPLHIGKDLIHRRRAILSEGVHKKKIVKLPWLRKPREGNDGKWLREEDEATEWLSLFYDLVVVAVLTVFSSTHEIRTPDAISVFLSYFVIIHWVWTSQTTYDIQYQADDIYHRFVKSLQIAVFVYIGSGSGKWNPGSIQDPSSMPGISNEESIAHSQALESFTTVGSAYAASRFLMCVQYLVCWLLGRRLRRPLASVYISIGTFFASCILIVAAVTLPSTSPSHVKAKICLLYASILLELLSIRVKIYLKQHGNIDSGNVAERYGAFTLIILGEGFISIIRAMNDTITSISAKVSVTYAQLVLAIFILVMLWHILFGRFDKSDKVSPVRALLWEGVHFPLHFALLLLLAAMVNTVIDLSVYNGVQAVINSYLDVTSYIANGTEVPESLQTYTESLLGRLPLEPPYETHYHILMNLSESQDPAIDGTILSDQYFGQIVVVTFESYGVEPSEEAEDTYNQLYSLNTSHTGPDLIERQQESADLVINLSTIIAEASLSGITWLFPSAGIVLICATIRSTLWYRFEGIGHWIVHSLQFGTGVILCLMTLLDIGPETINVTADDILAGTAPIYQLLGTQTPLIIIAAAFFIQTFVTLFILDIVNRLKGGVFDQRTRTQREEDAEGEGEGEGEGGEREHHERHDATHLNGASGTHDNSGEDIERVKLA
ncbi:hypothetical protein BD324DRAFT_640417 [Kockovaella imperatae]|uniref:Bacterial low temperature requirement A protein-domain-containing protein n=1 Tax=Kockovaella imperatae TaxID=4999 RepID=A0A1Y1U6X3_9TREE|nr:hypothetical protein BD324DRAFT_640417 [Kockovaella imperatae]ORX33247.1 hypothetical protein BD324DRAFT_640417 [Kockovaella imperatae]